MNTHCDRWERRDSVESSCQTEGSKDSGEEDQPRQLTPFEKLTQDMCQDEKVVREITLGKRIGFYRIRGEIGSGNFSQVKLGIHSLTKGRIGLIGGGVRRLLKALIIRSFGLYWCVINNGLECYRRPRPLGL